MPAFRSPQWRGRRPCLPPVYREVSLLSPGGGEREAEVSEIPALPERTGKTCLHRARRLLIDFLSKEGFS